jgi:hypothetical protein
MIFIAVTQTHGPAKSFTMKIIPYLGVIGKVCQNSSLFLQFLLDRSGKWMDNKTSLRVRTRNDVICL